MSKVAIVTDSNSGITLKESKNTDIFVLPMPFMINGEEYLEEVNLTQEKFYEKLQKGENVSTSQPSPGSILDMWESILKKYDEIVYLPMSSGLSASTQTAISLANDYPNVYVVDNQRISVTQRQSVLDAEKLAHQGKSAKEIHDYLMETKFNSSIYITVGTLKYLKKGGRITPAAAAFGALLNIKPILQIQGAKLDAFAKVLTIASAKQRMINAVKNDFETRFKKFVENNEMAIDIAHTNNEEEAIKFKAEVEKAFPNIKVSFINPLSLSISCHIGPGSLAIATSRIVK